MGKKVNNGGFVMLDKRAQSQVKADINCLKLFFEFTLKQADGIQSKGIGQIKDILAECQRRVMRIENTLFNDNLRKDGE